MFKKFANVNSIDLEVDTKDPDELIRTVKLLEPSFGGVNLEGTVSNAYCLPVRLLLFFVDQCTAKNL